MQKKLPNIDLIFKIILLRAIVSGRIFLKWMLFLSLIIGTVFLSPSFVLAAPIVTSVTPSSGPTAGGTAITVNGTGFDRVGEIWGKQTTGLQNNIPNDVATDSSGNVYMTGSFEDTITFDGVLTLTSGGSTDVWLAKYNSAGTFLWARRGGSTAADVARGIRTDNGGNVYVTGSFSGTATFGALPSIVSAGNTDSFVIKYNSAGTEQWIRRGGGTGADLTNGVSVDASGSVLIAGNFANTATFGAFSSASTGSNDVFVVKYNSAGTEQWLYRPTGGGSDNGNDIDIDSTGNALITGFYTNTLTVGATVLPNTGNTDIFLFKLNTSGVPQWAKAGVGAGPDVGRGVATDSQNNVYITGSYRNSATFGALSLPSSGNLDVFIVGYNSSGTEIWAKTAVGADDDQGNGLATDIFSNLYVTGQYLSTSFAFNTVTLTNGVSQNPFLVKYFLTPRITIDGNNCLNIVYISTTQLTCVTPVGTTGPKNVVVTNPDGTTFTLPGGFVYGGSLVFAIRNAADTASSNSCDLGVATASTLASCSYRLKVSTDAANGYTISMQTSGGLSNGIQTLNDALAGSGGTGGTNISAGTVGVENYGALISTGSITSGGTILRTAIFNAGSINSVRTNYTSPQAMIQANNPNQPSITDLTNTTLITHNLNIANDSVAGDYAQTVTYTVVANF